MASLYYRGDLIWMGFRDENGKRCNRSTGYRKSNPGERKQAQLLCERQTHAERLQAPAVRATDWVWVDEWLEQKWGNRERTHDIYASHWRALQRWLTDPEVDINAPATLTREACLRYPEWRLKRGGKRNTAIGELKLLGQIMKEARVRKMVTENVASALGIEREDSEEGRAWTDEEFAKVNGDLLERDKFGWKRATFLLGRFQAARHGSCAVPLKYIDLEAKTITFHDPKGGISKAYTQPIDRHLWEPLREIIEYRKSRGKKNLCDIPDFKKGDVPASVQWRRYLDSLGIFDISHHDLRRTWVTKAALAGIPETIACRFSNHSSLTVHRIYQKFTTADIAEMLTRL
jgi:hypothetical protein